MEKIILLIFVLFTISFINDGSTTNYTTENINIEDSLRDMTIIKDNVLKGCVNRMEWQIAIIAFVNIDTI